MVKRKSFLLHIDSLDILDDLNDNEVAQLFKAIRDYHLGREITLSPIVKIAFSPFKNQFIRDDEKYINICNRNKNNGLKGGRPKPKLTQKTQSVILEPKKADSDSDSKNDNDSDNKRKKFKPPTIEELTSYITENSYFVDPEKFINHYQANNWYRGKTKIKDWKACVRTWNINKKEDANVVQYKKVKLL